MTNFIKEGNIITPFPKGIGYDLEPSKVYDLMYEPFGIGKYLKLNGSLNIPKKYIITRKIKRLLVKC